MVVPPVSRRFSIGSIGVHSYHQVDIPSNKTELTYHPYNPILSVSQVPWPVHVHSLPSAA